MTFKDVYFLVEKSNVIIVPETSFHILSPYFIADRTVIKVVRKIMKDAVRTQTNMSHITGCMSDQIS